LTRRAKQSDLDRIVYLARRFHDAVQPEWPWCADDLRAFAATMIEQGHVTVSPHGFMIGGMAAHPLNRQWRVAAEYLWWAEDASGPRHFRAFRRWAKEQGAQEIRWSCRDDNARVKRFYAGFAAPVEAHYSELLTCA